MNAIADITTANGLAQKLEAAEARRLGASVRAARESLARRLKVPFGTLENLRRLRLKVVPHWLMARIRAELVVALLLEVARLEHEIAIHRQIGTDPREDALVAAQARVVEAREVLRGTRS